MRCGATPPLHRRREPRIDPSKYPNAASKTLPKICSVFDAITARRSSSYIRALRERHPTSR